jgi:hypothetical protein
VTVITVDEYRNAVSNAQNQVGPVVADIICPSCNRRVGNVSRRPRGLYLESKLEDMAMLGIERILHAHDTGRSYDHLTPEGWSKEQVERVIDFATSDPNYKPRLERLDPGHKLMHALIDLHPPGLPDARYEATVMCRAHGNITFDTRPLRKAIENTIRGRLRFVVPPPA